MAYCRGVALRQRMHGRACGLAGWGSAGLTRVRMNTHDARTRARSEFEVGEIVVVRRSDNKCRYAYSRTASPNSGRRPGGPQVRTSTLTQVRGGVGVRLGLFMVR